MLTHTSETAIRALVYLALRQSTEPLTPTQIAEEIDASSSYLAKILRMLGKSGIVNARRGAQGGVMLARRPESITLLQIMESCQGLLIANYCEALVGHTAPVCAFHEAMVEVQAAMTGVLRKWTLADMVARPFSPDNRDRCRINIDPGEICGRRLGAGCLGSANGGNGDGGRLQRTAPAESSNGGGAGNGHGASILPVDPSTRRNGANGNGSE